MRPLYYALLIAAVSVASGCKKKKEEAGVRTYEIAVIPKGTTHEFWKSIHAGALKAREELVQQGTPVNLNWKGPLREDDRDQQIQVVENFTVRKVDGIVLAPLDSQALVAPVEAAVAAKIPVVIIDSALKSSRPVSYVATDNYKGGTLAAQYMGRLLNGEGNVVVLRYQVGSASTEQREAGFIDTLQKEFPKVKLISTNQYAGATRDSALRAAQNLLNRYGYIKGAFAPCEPVTIGLMLALRDMDRAGGKIKLVGFDASAAAVEGLKRGDIQGLIVQDPVRMGYLGVKTMVEHLQGKPVPKVIDTGVQLVTRENMSNPEIEKLLNPPLDQYLKGE